MKIYFLNDHVMFKMNPIHRNLDEDVIVIYHSNCIDGVVSAFTMWKEFGKTAEYYPAQFNSSPPDVTNKLVYILDFSYSANILQEMIKKSKKLLIIDHHETSMDNLASIPDKYKQFDSNECGSTLTWKFLNPDTPIPLLYKYVKSRDLWTHEMPNTDEFALAFDAAIRGKNGQYSFELIDRFLDDKEIRGLIGVGKVLLPYQTSLIDKSIDRAFFCPVWIPKPEGDTLAIVAYVNTPSLISDTGARCLEKFGFVDLCVMFYIDSLKRETQFCLRSADDREDVRKIAENFGGGGHRNAASFRISGLHDRLDYEHMDPIPLMCMLRGRSLRIDHQNSPSLFNGYLQLLKQKFPGQTLQIDLQLE